MAKALYGQGGDDVRLTAELSRLKGRVRELEAEVRVLRGLLGMPADDAPRDLPPLVGVADSR
ncbi:MAG: hypothetical protein ACR2KE_00705 [Candidatus Nanopelagicales bacterium]